MYIDKNLEFSDAQAVTSTAISTNVLDSTTVGAAAGTASPNLTIDQGVGSDLWLVVQTAVTCTDVSSDATLTITLESDDNAGLSSSTVHFSTGALAFATYATAGTRVLAVRLPIGLYERYIGLRYTVASGPLTAGAFDAFLTTDPGVNRVYKTGFTVQ